MAKKASKPKAVNGIPLSILPGPMWTLEMGVSYSLLNRFVQCKDRFHMYAVKGMRETTDRQDNLNFGTYFHKLLEISAKDQRCSANKVIEKVTRSKSSIAKIKMVDRLMANMIYQEYVNHFQGETHRYFDTETKFDVKYALSGVGSIRLVGKMDQTIINSDRTLKIQENKTAEKIKDALLGLTIPHNLQTMMYAICAESHFKRPVTGVLYNVIRKPTYKQGNLSDEEHVERVRQELLKDPARFFYRWNYDFTPNSIKEFKQFTFDPILRDFYLWWKSIESNPLDPWVDQNGQPNSRHYRRPFGVYDSLTNGEGDFFNAITRNSMAGITFGNEPFSELKEDV